MRKNHFFISLLIPQKISPAQLLEPWTVWFPVGSFAVVPPCVFMAKAAISKPFEPLPSKKFPSFVATLPTVPVWSDYCTMWVDSRTSRLCTELCWFL